MGVMLELWAEKCHEVERTIDLLEHLEAERAITWDTTMSMREVVCKFHEIDLRQLDRERREVLEAQRKVNEGK
jgi:hypothetical protein